MAGKLKFNREYASFGNKVRPFEKSAEVGKVLLWILNEWPSLYPLSALINSKISAIYLGKGEKTAGDIDNLDLIFKMAESGAGIFEIILRSEGHLPVYGGWAVGDTLEVTDEIVNGHRVLIGKIGSEKLRHEYRLDVHMYALADAALDSTLSTAVARILARKSPR